MQQYNKPIKCFTYVLNHEQMASHMIRILLLLVLKSTDNPGTRRVELKIIPHPSKSYGLTFEINHLITDYKISSSRKERNLYKNLLRVQMFTYNSTSLPISREVKTEGTDSFISQ
jgi:hypothetical protein